MVEQKVGVEALGNAFGGGLVFEGDLVENVFASDGIEQVGFSHNGVVFAAEAKNLRANFFGFGNAVDAKFTPVAFEQFAQTALYAIVR